MIAFARVALRRVSRTSWLVYATVGFLLLMTAIFCLHSSRYSGFLADDTLISLRYSERLLAGRGLTWTDGERVEGYSNLLWVLLCALPGLVGVDLIDGVRVLGHCCVVAIFGALIFAVHPKRLIDFIPPLLGSLMLVATPAVAAWAYGGLEGLLATACLVWAVALLASYRLDAPAQRTLRFAAICLGLLCWTRPDGPIFAAILSLITLTYYRRQGLRPALWLALVPAAFVAAQLLFRISYYGDYLPNTAYAKVALTPERTEMGLTYVLDSLRPLGASWLALLLGLAHLLVRELRPMIFLVLGAVVVWCGYLVRIGGDIFPSWRHLLIVVGLAALVLTWMLKLAINAGQLRASASWGVAMITLAFLAGQNDPADRALTERWEWDGQPLGRVLRQAFSEQAPLLAVDAAGSLPYFSRLPSLDLLGLNDRYLAHHRPTTMGQGWMGHELGDAEYYWQRQPDIFCFGPPPCRVAALHPSEIELAATKRFRRAYDLVFVEARRDGQRLTSPLYVRRSGRIGLEKTERGVRIPALLLARSQSTPAVLKADRLEVRMTGGSSVRFDRLDLPEGRWKLQAQSSGDLARVEVITTDGTQRQGGGYLEFDQRNAAPVRIELRAGQNDIQLLWVDLERL